MLDGVSLDQVRTFMASSPNACAMPCRLRDFNIYMMTTGCIVVLPVL